MSNLETLWEKADGLYQAGKREEAKSILSTIVKTEVESDDSEGITAKEQAIYRLGELYTIAKDHKAIVELLRGIRGFFNILPKAKTTKIVRKLFDSTFTAGASLDEQQDFCKEMIEWSTNEKRTFLRHRLELRLARILFDKNQCLESLAVINALLKEVRRLDDRTLLVDVHLLESCVYFRVKNISKSRAALVSARTNANAIYCSPLSQAEIDMQSGILCAEEKDFKTAYSYLYEAFEGYHQLGDHARNARQALRYMILSKIVGDTPDELKAVLQSRNVLEYSGRDMDALRAFAEAWQKKDTHSFTQTRAEYEKDFADDAILSGQLNDMHDSLIEKHLLRIIEPYNRVQISYIAELMKLEVEEVESRLSQLILDKKLSGIVDQHHECLVVFEAGQKETKDAHNILFKNSLEALENMDKLVTALFDKVNGKFDHLIEENIKKSSEEAQKRKEREAAKAKEKAGGSTKEDEENKKKEADKNKK